ncbi:hypothetical protein HPP92_016330 [Vanilla planifolia]|uniref:Uncharacterized protein n=1 Tax=Vanilla planifolia TaxID=51239 RepID=A0A835UR58_VANPL|nr:hypothetical protein HPP92_016330 [Vanilla planifolia]
MSSVMLMLESENCVYPMPRQPTFAGEMSQILSRERSLMFTRGDDNFVIRSEPHLKPMELDTLPQNRPPRKAPTFVRTSSSRHRRRPWRLTVKGK